MRSSYEHLFVLPACVLTVCLGCSSDGAGTAVNTPSHSDAGADASKDSSSDSPFVLDAPAEQKQGCASGILCGSQGTCCGAGTECYNGACATVCQSGIHCGGVCCPTGNLCVAGTCVVPTTACQDSVDCTPSEFCEPGAGACVPDLPGSDACTYKRPKTTFSPELKWKWDTAVAQPGYYNAISAPLVADIDKDGTPDVVFTSTNNGSTTPMAAGYMRVLNGKTGAEMWDAATEALQSANQVNAIFSPALGDLDGDGTVEVVAIDTSKRIIAFNGDGSVRWRSTNANAAAFAFGALWGSSISIADMDHDGKAEVVMSGVVLDDKGVVVSGSAATHAGGYCYSDSQTCTTSSILADVDADGMLEVVTGQGAYHKDGTQAWQQGADGFPAIADFDADGKPELVVAASGNVRVLDAATGDAIATATLSGGRGGPPVIADFDGDGKIDVGVQQSTGCSFSMFAVDIAAKTITEKWNAPLKECSGFFTSSAFDFDGDGAVEVLAHDDCFVSVLNGADGAVMMTLPASHATWTEFVSVADVDGDLSADLLFSANDEFNGGVYNYETYCSYTGTDEARHGVYVYSDPKGAWMPTRRVWNEQAYHITNVRSNGQLPAPEPDSWGANGFNNYRVSAQGKGATRAADLTVSLYASLLETCPGAIRLLAVVENKGSVSAPPGVSVSFFKGTPPSGTWLGASTTKTLLTPGASTTVSLDVPSTSGTAYYAVVDSDQQGNGTVTECDETNNTASMDGVTCTKAPR
ncbi:MAG: VCBS repeat-containing protein [Deltaproteobacteria bacterium]|nr:VCBS repeat-containing protein [Deltaproteobacteria bacterium]